MVRSISAMGPERSIDRPTVLAHARRLTSSLLSPLAETIDRQGVYPKAELKQLAASGLFSAHLRAYGQPADLGLSILLIAEVAKVCGSSGFVGWCQAACGVYLEESGNPALTGSPLQAHIHGQGLGGTGLSNP
ncbi:MAG: acyl-CoA dehydrogenase family protein, partial [Cyanobacteriota bacterium]|nr:acyl-CoA dehydrogenase family protein [Cyanobacteriota bacterium]